MEQIFTFLLMVQKLLNLEQRNSEIVAATLYV